MTHLLSAVIRNLDPPESQGNIRKPETAIEFSIVSTSTAIGAVERQMDEAFGEVNETLREVNHLPSLLESAAGSVDEVTSGINNAIAIGENWEPFLEKVKEFTKIVDGISQVGPALSSLL